MDAEKLAEIEREIALIKERNVRVEAEKAWEGSTLRIGTIMVMTYAIACAALYAIGNDHPFRNAFVPTLGFFLSTLSIPFLKKVWMNSYTSNGKS